MSDTATRLKNIYDKLQQLVRDRDMLRRDNERLRTELDQSLRQLGEYQENIENLKQQVGILKLNTADMSERDKKEFEKKLNRYIKDIDRCIAMLGE